MLFIIIRRIKQMKTKREIENLYQSWWCNNSLTLKEWGEERNLTLRMAQIYIDMGRIYFNEQRMG